DLPCRAGRLTRTTLCCYRCWRSLRRESAAAYYAAAHGPARSVAVGHPKFARRLLPVERRGHPEATQADPPTCRSPILFADVPAAAVARQGTGSVAACRESIRS